MKLKLYASLIVLFTVILYAQSQKPDLEKLDSYFSNALKDWNVPGMAIGILKSDSIILAKGYGVRNVKKEGEVDAHTVFPIASNTKAFTSAAIASLIDKKLLSWDSKVVDFIPYFQLYDPYVSLNMTIRDLLCHRSGLATFSGDLLWFNSNYSREEVIRRARYLVPKYGFRTTFGYSNILFITAGEIIAALTEQSWDDYLADNFFKPLGMTRTNTSVSFLENMDNVALPHNDIGNKVVPIPYQNWDNVGGAGAINSCVNDMLKWLQLQLHEGTINNKVYYSERTALEMWTPHTIQVVSPNSKLRFPSIHFKAYGLGWALFDYRGRKIISHSGGYDGMISYSCLVPEEQLAFVILTNKNSALYYPLVYKILDEFLEGTDRDWSSEILEIIVKNEGYDKERKEKQMQERILNTKTSLNLSAYAGIYESELYGQAELKLKNKKLLITLIPSPLFTAELEHWQFNTFTVNMTNFPSLPEGKVHFYMGMDGSVEEMKIDIPNPDFDFTELKFIKLGDP